MIFRTYLGRALLPLISLSTALPAQADLLRDIHRAGKIRVAIAETIPPFIYEDGNKQLAGSDPETARLLAQDLGVKLEIVRTTNSERLPALHKHQADLVISTLSITPEREREIAFSVPYARISLKIAAPFPNKLSSLLDLDGKTVGVLATSSNLAHLRRNAPGVKIIEYPEHDKLKTGYLAGEFQIISAPQSVIDDINKLKPRHPLVVQFTQTEFDVAIGIPAGEKGLRNWVNHWVSENLGNGRLNEIYRKYHGHNLPSELLPSTGRR
ncbi:MAG: amino acid transporter [Proteobacteria bacterium]|nr:amino acid transporter [Pseudomonadota bacterium]